MHKKLLAIFSLLLLLLFFTSIVNAQTNTGTTSADRLRKQLQDIQTQKRSAVSDIKKEAKETRAELRQQIKDTVAAKKEAVRETVAARREEFKTKLQTIKDQKKKALTERIDAKLANANTKHTDRFTQVLSNLQNIVDKVNEDTDKTEAQAAIDTARTAVENQAAKTYTITISTETALRLDVGAVTSQLRLDLMATHKAVVDAKQALQALRTNNAIMKKGATGSANL